MESIKTYTENLKKELDERGCKFVFAIKTNSDACIGMSGKDYELLFLMNRLYNSLRDNMVKDQGERMAKDKLRLVTMSEEEVKEEAHNLMMKMFMSILGDEEDEDDDDESEEAVPDSDTDEGDEDARKKAISELARILHSALHGNFDDIEFGNGDREDDRG